jgi:hypothetical protein
MAFTPAQQKQFDESAARLMTPDATDADPEKSPGNALIRAHKLLDDAAMALDDRALARKACEAGARAGLVARGVCFCCHKTPAHPLPMPGQPALASAWICDACESAPTGKFRV